jgi:acetyl esterase/lipase
VGRPAVMVVAVVLALLAAGAAALMVADAPSMTFAELAIGASEKSLFVAALGAVALVLALIGLGPKSRIPGGLAVLLSLAAIGVGIIPPVQARVVAGAQRVKLDFGRYLLSGIDGQGPGRPDTTIEHGPIDGGQKLAVDVYLPKARPSTPGRALLVVHGGFWSAGKKGEAWKTSRRLADLGYTVFDLEYRLGPQPNWKSAVGDVKCAIGWIKQNAAAKQWNVDPNKLTLYGRSAGGHLALMAAYSAGAADLPPSCPASDTSVESVVALYAPTDLAWGHANPANPGPADGRARIRAFLGGPPDELAERYLALSPVARVSAKSPRTLLAHGARDQIVRPEHMDRLVTRLLRMEVKTEALLLPYAQHAFDFIVGGFSSQLLEATVLRFAPPG